MRVVGILGGMGPQATCDLFMKIIRNTPAQKDQDHLRVIIDSNPKIPDRTAYILSGGEDPRPLLFETAKNVERAGASFIAIPCNTAHYFHKEIQRQVDIPVLHMMEEVARYLNGKANKAGLLATTGTLRTGLYARSLSKVGIETVIPSDEDQDSVMEAIYLVKASMLEKGRKIILEQARKLEARGCDVVIAGCTEIPLILKDGDLGIEVVDATDILAKACVGYGLSK
ncbi:MAG: amino acid racemase [Firmicutes bacterium]|jgi:aspartate racemase|nr:amino acid racemase [Candidatus Fermentithermobacillaceae bacterium]